MNAALIAMLSVVGTGIVSLLGAILLGKLVPAGQVSRAQAEADKWRLAYEEKSAALAKLEEVVERQQIVTETVNAVLAALKQTAQIPPSSSTQTQVGGSA